MTFTLGMPSQRQLHDLTQEVWAGDDSARFILADAYDELDRHDIAMLWRDELPGYKRRKRCLKLTSSEKDEIVESMQWWAANVQLHTGPMNEALALAAVGCLYRASWRVRTMRRVTDPLDDFQYPQFLTLLSPMIVRKRAEVERADRIWFSRRTWDHDLAHDVYGFIGARSNEIFPDTYLYQTQKAAEDQDETLSAGLSAGQFSRTMLTHGAIIDILRIDQVGNPRYEQNSELSLRASLALTRCTPYYHTFPNICMLSQPPTVIDGVQPRWGWLDDNSIGYQWPTTR